MEQPLPKSSHPSLPFDRWPAADRDAWNACNGEADFFDESGRAAVWRETSRISAERAYGRWLYWLDANGVGTGAEEPVARFSADRIRTYLAFLAETRAPVTLASYLGVLCMVVVALYPDENWSWLRKMQSKMRRGAQPVRRKDLELVAAEDVAQLGLDLMEASQKTLASVTAIDTRMRVAAARDFRDGLLIALLAHRPLRVRNLLGIAIGQTLLLNQEPPMLSFKPSETKNKLALNFPWPEILRPALDIYMKTVRPILMGANAPGQLEPSECPARLELWVSQGGRAFSEYALWKALRRRTQAKFGKPIVAQRFRDIVASSMANNDPSHIRYAAQLLGHAGLRTTENNYIVPDSQVALTRYHELLLSTRKTGSKIKKRAPEQRL